MRWHVDDRWYRAFVMEVFTNYCKIKLVDYGTEEICFFDNMRKQLDFTEEPVMCVNMKLDNVRPGGDVWSEEVLTFLHQMVVDKDVIFTISDTLQSEVLLLNRLYFNPIQSLFF